MKKIDEQNFNIQSSLEEIKRRFERIQDEYNIHNINTSDVRKAFPLVKEFKKVARTYKIKPTNSNKHNLSEFFYYVQKPLQKIYEYELSKNPQIKTNLCFRAYFKMEIFNPKTKEYETKRVEALMWSSSLQSSVTIVSHNQIKPKISHMLNGISENISNFTENGSQWIFDEVIELNVNIIKYNPLKGSSYFDLPPVIKNKKGCINIKNNDQKCFLYSVICGILHKHGLTPKDPQRVTKYYQYIYDENKNEKDIIEIKISDNKKYSIKHKFLKYPVDVTQIPKFEKENKIVINAFMWQDGLRPLYVTNKWDDPEAINLLLATKGNKTHWVLINNIDRLLFQEKSRNEMFHCLNCLHHFSTRDKLKEHRALGCDEHESAKVVLPTKANSILNFKAVQKQLKAPFVIYADFESILVKVDEQVGDKTKIVQEHKIISYGYIVVSKYPELTKPYKSYRATDINDNVALKFLQALKDEEEWIMNVIKTNNPINMSVDDLTNFNNAINCHICGKQLGNDRVRDHDHYTGKYRGAAHNDCNLHYSIDPDKYKIPVFFHNLRGYDSNFIIQQIAKVADKINVIPNTMDKYISFAMDRFEFKDSCQFLQSSLEKLAESLNKENGDYKILSSEFNGKIDLLIQKGVYPYEYMDSIDRFNEDKLPPKTAFYSSLTEENITDDDYDRAQKVWKEYDIKNLGDYHDLYLKTDVCLLADIFERFRDISLNIYKLDPAHYYTAPGLAWDAALKITDVKLELLTDINMLLMIERGMRGGISMISKRFAQANNPYMGKLYDSNKETSYLLYIDCNNLYGWAMSQPLPTSGFKWNRDKWTVDKILDIDNDGDIGYIFDVDLDYPEELHDEHNCYPLAPENTNPVESRFMKAIREKYDLDLSKEKKLIPNLNNKKNYVVHYRNLQLYLQLGLKLKKVHRVLQFKQSPWLKKYIELNTNERKNAKTDFEKDFYKLMNNSVFGKTMENVRKRVNIVLVKNTEKALEKAKRPNFKRFQIINNDLLIMEMQRLKVLINKPIFVGFSILDLSKVMMYDFHYNVMKKKYGKNIELCFTDTDSFLYHIKTNDVYKDILQMKDKFDLSEYPKDSEMYDPTNKKVIGKFKDEVPVGTITEFVGLKAKMYSTKIYINDNKYSEKKRGKGISKHFMKKHISHENYRNAILGNDGMQNAQFKTIRAVNQKLYTFDISKTGLCVYDDKRIVLDDGITTLAIGHKNSKNYLS